MRLIPLSPVFMPNPSDRDAYLFPHSQYQGEFKPDKLVFNANLQEFAQRVSYICNLETAGKIDTLQAYEQIKSLWKKLSQSKKELGIGENSFNPEGVELPDDDE